MQPDPQVRAFLAQLAQAKAPGYESMGVKLARRVYSQRADMNMPTVEVAEVRDIEVQGGAGKLAARLYRAQGSAAEDILPALVYFHGGGWVLGDLETHDPICRELANLARCAVIAVAYRLSPEHKFPEPVEDAIASTRDVIARAAELRIDPKRIAVGGDSAGGTMAAVTAIVLRDAGGPPLVMQLMIYPPTDISRADTPSHLDFAEGCGLSRASVLWFREQYLPEGEDGSDWRASPLRAPDLSRLPPACIITAGFDTLRDDGRLYAEALQKAGVTVSYECFEGMIHGFINMGRIFAAARHALYRSAQALQSTFDPKRPY